MLLTEPELSPCSSLLKVSMFSKIKKSEKQTEYQVSGLMPNHRYTYRVTALSAQGEIEAVNTMGIKTSPLESPEVLDATEITENSFVANWDIVSGAEHYLIDLYTLIGDEEVEIFETFTNVKDGKPLPEGWTGNASGHYGNPDQIPKNPIH